MFAPAALLLATLVAATSLDAAHAAVRRAMAAGGDSTSCSAAELTSIASDASIRPLSATGPRNVVLATVGGSCICGNVNCPYYVLQLGPAGTSRVLLSTYAYDVHGFGNARPLPQLRESAHDSALVTVETIDAFSGGRYVPVSSARVRGDTGERKGNAIPVRFAPGTSSAVLTGLVSTGWYDEYAITAARGQDLTIGALRVPAGTTFGLIPRNGSGTPIDLRPGVATPLPASGSYLLMVDTDSESSQTYRATVTIR
jgi:hypothetical protein